MSSIASKISISDKSQSLTISWEDQHESHYPWWYLRGFCPCAACQGHGGAYEYVTTDANELGDVREVGNYAVNITWVGGHDTGIYPFELLRRLCPCGACRAEHALTHVARKLPASALERLDGPPLPAQA